MNKDLYQKIYYSTGRFRYVSEFFNEKALQYATSIEANKLVSLGEVEKKLLRSIKVENLVKEGSRSKLISDLVPRINLYDLDTKIGLSFNISGVFNVVQRGNRSSYTEIKSANITPNTVFFVKNKFLIYNKESFSISLLKDTSERRADDIVLGFSIAVIPSSKGLKGLSSAIVKVITADRIIIDDLSKYMCVTQLTSGIS